MSSSAWWWLIFLMFAVSVALRNGLLFLVTVLLVLVALASRLWSRYCLEEVTYRRRMGVTHLNFGEETDLWIEIENAKALPLAWLRIDDELPTEVRMLTGIVHPSHKGTRVILTNLLSLRWYERVTRHYRLLGNQRGAFEFGPAQLESSDIFGFAHRYKQVDKLQTLIVYPRVVPLTQFGLPSQHPFGDAQAPRRLMEDPLRMLTVRAYAPGDSLRHVHWKATARTGQLQTKIYEPTTTWQLVIFLDVQTTDRAYHVVREYLELGVTATASVARYALEAGYAVGLHANTSARFAVGHLHVAASRHPEQFVELLEALARLIPFSIFPLELLLEREAPTLPFGATVVVVSSVLGEALLSALLDLKHDGHAVTLLAIGDAPPPAIGGVSVHWLGGAKAWHELEALELA